MQVHAFFHTETAFFAVWRAVMGLTVGHHGSPTFPTTSTCCSYHALAQFHCSLLGSRSSAKVKQGPTGKYNYGKDPSLSSSPISDFAGDRNAAMLGILKGRAQRPRSY